MIILVLWGIASYWLLGISISKFIENKKELHEGEREKSGMYVGIILSSISCILFVVVGIVFVYVVMCFCVEGTLAYKILGVISIWPIFSGCFLGVSVQYKIDAIAQPKLQRKAKRIHVLSIMTIVLYYCFLIGLLYYSVFVKGVGI